MTTEPPRSGRGRGVPSRPATRSWAGSRAAAARAGRDPGAVTLVAVSKTVPADRVRAAVAGGLRGAGREPRPGGCGEDPGGAGRRMAPHRATAGEQGAPRAGAVRRHRGGPLRWSWPPGSTASPREDPAAPAVAVLLQVNVDRDPAKAGFDPGALAAAVGPARRAGGARRARPDDDRAPRGRPRGRAPHVHRPAGAVRVAARALAAPRPGALDGHVRRLRGGRRGGRDDRPGRAGDLRLRARRWSSARRLTVASRMRPPAARFSVRLTPRAGADRVDGVVDGILRARVAAPPVDGAANEALLRLLADELGVPAATCGWSPAPVGASRWSPWTGWPRSASTGAGRGCGSQARMLFPSGTRAISSVGQSARFTSVRSLVRAQYRPPLATSRRSRSAPPFPSAWTRRDRAPGRGPVSPGAHRRLRRRRDADGVVTWPGRRTARSS